MAESWRSLADWRRLKRWTDRDAILERLGLEERTPVSDFFSGLGMFAIGILVGAGLGVLFAPRRGEEVRQAVGEAWRNRVAAKPQEWERDLGAEHGVPRAQ